MKNLSNEELVKYAGQTVIGTPSGLAAQEAQAELTRRLIVSNNSLRDATLENNGITRKFNEGMLILTIILTLLAGLQIVASILPHDISPVIRFGVIFAPALVIFVGLKYKV